MPHSYSNKKLFQIAKDNYDILYQYCSAMAKAGYWDEPGNVLQKSIYEMLDLYVQALLLKLAICSNCFTKEEAEFILAIPRQNMIGIKQNTQINEEIKYEVQKILNTPPILLQLCGLYDQNTKENTINPFFDCILNILLAMSYLNGSRKIEVKKFIQDYYAKVRVFLNTNNGGLFCIDNRYIFKKLSSGDFDKSREFFELQPEEQKLLNECETAEIGKVKIRVPAIEKIKQAQEEQEDVEQEAQQPSEPEEEQKDNLELLLAELNGLVGLQEVKDEINSLINLIKIRKLRANFALPQMDMSYHMVFTGNPGTGKTTVARLVAKIYKELGILSAGNLVETDRSGLIAGYVGQTALKVKEVVEKAIGGVLFIDEAYSLTSAAGNNDFGSEAVDTLVKLMEDNRDNLVVIVAGYKEEMKQFLKSNTGLISRFNKFIEFHDYSVEDLSKILKVMAEKSGMTLEKGLSDLLKEKLTQLEPIKKQNFGNARGIRNLFEKMVVHQANRLVDLKNPSKEQLMELKQDDLLLSF